MTIIRVTCYHYLSRRIVQYGHDLLDGNRGSFCLGSNPIVGQIPMCSPRIVESVPRTKHTRMKNYGFRYFFVWLLLFVVSLPCFAFSSQIEWTVEEKEFLQTHPVIRLGVDPGFAPFEYIDDEGEYEGLAADYLKLISEATGLRFEPVLGLTWPQAYELAMAGDIDVLPAVGKTPEREQHFLLTRAYYHFKRVIVTRDTDSWITGMDDLEGRTVAVQRHSSQHSYLQAFPKINLSLYETVDSALAAVATGEELAFLGNLATTNYLIRSHGMTNLRFVAFEAESQQSLHIAVRKDWPVLAGS